MSSKVVFLEKIFGKGQYSHNTHELGIRCPWCFHYKNKLFINTESDNWHCFVCGKAGKSLVSLIKKSGNRSDLNLYLKEFKAKSVTFSSADSATKDKFTIALPKEYRPLIENLNTLYGKRAMQYLKNKRGMTEDDVLFYKIGIAFNGLMQDRVIFPCFDIEGELNFYTTRSIVDGKMNHWSPSVPDDYKHTQIFNELYVDWSKPIVLVEGFVDSVKARNSIPLMGSSLDPEYKIFQSIVRSGLPVYLAFDADAFNKTNRIAEMFMRYDVDVNVIDVSPFNDCGEMTKQQFVEKFDQATPYSKELIFRNRLRMLK